MLKSTFRFVLLFVATALISAIAASSAYFITKNILEKKNMDTGPASANTIQTRAESQDDASKPLEFSSYIVRLEDNAICVYTLSNQTEEFLYSTDIYRPNLSAEDISLLTSGVTLDTASELTGFMENYTS